VTMISHGVEISIAGGEGEVVCGLFLGRFFFFFCNYAFIVSRYKKPHAALAMERTKPINQKQLIAGSPPISLSLIVGESKCDAKASVTRRFVSFFVKITLT